MFRHPGAFKLGLATRGHDVPDVQPQDWRAAAAHDAQTRARGRNSRGRNSLWPHARARRWRGGNGYGIVSR